MCTLSQHTEEVHALGCFTVLSIEILSKKIFVAYPWEPLSVCGLSDEMDHTVP